MSNNENRISLATIVAFEGVDSETAFIATWNASTNTPTLTATSTFEGGRYYLVQGAGTQFGISFLDGDHLKSIGEGQLWIKEVNNPASWGGILGTLSNQTDLNNALALKQTNQVVEITNFNTFNPDTDVRTKDLTIGQSVKINSFEATGRPVVDGLTYHSWCGVLMLVNTGQPSNPVKIWKYIVYSDALPLVEANTLFNATAVYTNGTKEAWTMPFSSVQGNINKTNIANLDSTKQGKLTSANAGTNITIDITDPAVPIINSTGGSGGGSVNVVNSIIGDLITNSQTTQTTTLQSSRVLCDGVTKLYPNGTAGQTLFYTPEFLTFMQTNYPANVNVSTLEITMPQIHEDDNYELIVNPVGSRSVAYKYRDGRLICRGGSGVFSGTTIFQTFPAVFSSAPIITNMYTQDTDATNPQGESPNNRVFNWYINGDTNYLYSAAITTTGFNAALSTAISNMEPRYTAEGVWKTYVARYQYMDVTGGTAIEASSNSGLPFKETGGNLEVTGEINLSVIQHGTGNITIVNDVASGFSGITGNEAYINSMDTFTYGAQPHLRYAKFTTVTDVTSEQWVISTTVDWTGWMAGILNGKIYSLGSSNGTSWNVISQTSTESVLPNTSYFVKMYWTGTSYKIDLSTDDVTWVNYINVASTVPITNYIPQYGSLAEDGFSGSLSFNGSIDFSNAYLEVNGIIIRRASFGKSIDFRGTGKFNNASGTNFDWTAPSKHYFTTMSQYAHYHIFAKDDGTYYITRQDEIYLTATKPTSTVINAIWVDNTTLPAVSKRYNGTAWVIENLSRCRTWFGILSNTINIMRNDPYGVRLFDWLEVPASNGNNYRLNFNNGVLSWVQV